MKRQYMDFVPTKSTKSTVTHTEKPASPVVSTHKTTIISTTTSRQVRATAPRPATVQKSMPGTSVSPKLGVIEDLSTQGSSAPTSHDLTPKPQSKSLKSIKAQKIGNRAPVTPVENSVENPAKNSSKSDPKRTFMPPKFINQDKVTKRPLSKNVYRKNVEPAKESTKKPVTIIAKPEKDTKVGVIITIIITIILGAAAGTVAFLLLPK